MTMLNNILPPDDFNDEKQSFGIGFEPSTGSGMLLVDITLFLSVIKSCYDAVDNRTKKLQIQRLLDAKDWVEHYKDKTTQRRVLSESASMEHKHELQTAKALAQVGYDVIFAPKGAFKEKKRSLIYFLFGIRSF